MEKFWIVVSNSEKYGLEHPLKMFEEAKNHTIQWGLPPTSLSELSVSDIVYLYSSPEKALILKARVIEINQEDRENMYFSMQLLEKLEPQIPLDFLKEKGIVNKNDKMQNNRSISIDSARVIQENK